MKRRGGVGHDLSHLRPKGMAVRIRPDLDRPCSIYGTLFELDTRGGTG